MPSLIFGSREGLGNRLITLHCWQAVCKQMVETGETLLRSDRAGEYKCLIYEISPGGIEISRLKERIPGLTWGKQCR
jgi:hypothetical protein